MEMPQYYNFLDDNAKKVMEQVFEISKASKCNLKEADKALDIVYNLLNDYKGFTIFDRNDIMAGWFQILVMSSYLYHIYYDPNEPFTSLFRPREYFYEMFIEESELSAGIVNTIFETVEGAEGYKNSNKLTVPLDSPGGLLNLAIWINKNKDGLYMKSSDIVFRLPVRKNK